MSNRIEQQISLYNSAAADNHFSEEEIKELEKAGISDAIRQELTNKTEEEMVDILERHLECDHIEEEHDNDNLLKNIGSIVGGITGYFIGSKLGGLVKHSFVGGLIGAGVGVILGAVTLYNLFKKDTTEQHNENYAQNHYLEILPASVDTVKSGENLTIICRRNKISKADLLKANPEITNENIIKAGQTIQIPERTVFKAGSIKNIDDICAATKVSKNYINDILFGFEGCTKEPALNAYYDNVPDETHSKGYLTIGFGHTGTINGEKITENTTIDRDKAYELLAQDIQNAKKVVIEYIGKENFEKAPQSIQDALIDIAFNKGIELGFEGIERDKNGNIKCTRNTLTQKLKEDIKKQDYVSAAKHVIFKTESNGLKRRNLYRLIVATKDLPANERKEVLRSAETYYQEIKSSINILEQTKLKKHLENADNGICTGFFD